MVFSPLFSVFGYHNETLSPVFVILHQISFTKVSRNFIITITFILPMLLRFFFPIYMVHADLDLLLKYLQFFFLYSKISFIFAILGYIVEELKIICARHNCMYGTFNLIMHRCLFHTPSCTHGGRFKPTDVLLSLCHFTLCSNKQDDQK